MMALHLISPITSRIWQIRCIFTFFGTNFLYYMKFDRISFILLKHLKFFRVMSVWFITIFHQVNRVLSQPDLKHTKKSTHFSLFWKVKAGV